MSASSADTFPADEVAGSSPVHMHCGRVLLKQGDWAVPLSIKGPHATTTFFDVDSIPYLVEVMVSRGVSEVLLEGTWWAEDKKRLRARLPRVLQRRVTFLDCRRTQRTVDSIFAPLGWEIGGHFEDGMLGFDDDDPALYTPLAQAAENIYTSLPSLVDGFRHHAMVDIDLVTLRRDLEIARTQVNDTGVRATLSGLQGVLSGYTLHGTAGLRVSLGNNQRHLRDLYDLVDDAEYERLSSGNYELGLPSLCMLALHRVRPLVRRLLAMPKLKAILGFAARNVAVAAKLPTPDSDFTAALLDSGYMPPIVELRGLMRRARAVWRRKIRGKRDLYKRWLDFAQVFRPQPSWLDPDGGHRI